MLTRASNRREFGRANHLGLGIRVLAGVQFDRRDTKFHGGVDLPLIWVDEQTDDDAGFSQLIDARPNSVHIANHIQSAFGRHLFPLFWDKRCLLRPDVQCDPRDFVRDGHFQVYFDLSRFANDSHITILNVAAVFTKMNRDPIGSTEFRQRRRPHGIGLDGSASLANGGHMVDVDSKFRH